MPFDAYQVGYEIMSRTVPGDGRLADAYGKVSAFLAQFPDMQASRTPMPIGPEFLAHHARGFVTGRQSRGPRIPDTLPDPRVKDILESAYRVEPPMLEKAIGYHMEAMGAENFIGWILESYIASEAEPLGWAWCSGTMIRAVDFICPLQGGTWKLLQVKNRSNSENSSSSRVRLGTSIEMWFRFHAYTGETRWNVFPDPELRTRLSEDGFRRYIVGWISQYFQQRP